MSEDNGAASSVLVVEDEKPLRDIYSIILSKAGYTVFTASNGQEGIEQVESHDPDFVLLDIFMPVMNGIDFMKKVDLEGHPDMQVVVFSNNSDSGVKDQMCKLGASDVILKSEMSPSGLVDMVGKRLSAGSKDSPCA